MVKARFLVVKFYVKIVTFLDRIIMTLCPHLHTGYVVYQGTTFKACKDCGFCKKQLAGN